MTTETTVIADLLDAIVNRLGDIAGELRSNLSSPVLAEVRAAAAAAERAYVLAGPWMPHTEDGEHDAIRGCLSDYIIANYGGVISMPTDAEFLATTIESSALDGADYVRVTMPGCVYLVLAEEVEWPMVDWTVVGRYPQ